MASSQPFSVLRSISKAFRGLGWLISGLGLLSTIVSLIALFGGSQSSSMETRIGLAISCAVIVIGLLIVAFGEIIGVVFAIESNTRQIAESLAPARKDPE